MNKNTLVVGFMLFAIFFGAGNLIFPPKLGFESGAEFVSSISGFVLTGVGLPLLGIIVSAFYPGGYKAVLDKIHPWFSAIFLIAIYLAIGPFFAGPRTAATAYEMAIMPFISEVGQLSLLIFTLVYFCVALWLSLNPTKVVDCIGAILTPVLLLAIIALVVKAVFLLSSDEIFQLQAPAVTENSYFFKGVVDGYLTMDALASLAYSVIVLNAIQSKSLTNSSLQRQTIFAALVAAVALALIYIGLGWIGNHMAIDQATLSMLAEKQLDLGTYILNMITTDAFGELGRAVLGIIVSLACLTTVVGLAVSVSEYFNEIFPRISYKMYVVLFTVISFIIANQGLQEVISKSIPVLLILYPIAMTVILLLLINLFIKLPLMAQRIALLLVTIIAVSSVIGLGFTEQLPLRVYSMEWLPFAVIGTIVGLLMSKLSGQKVA
ncbi:branched-chain amino acid ABC transporter substrate-binding protein [[Haemophilus] ducreyi]|uniref:branched-chain amino acid transport system II carrier protein n=1 Tax=Haemophilus ducreyi TaxID=730 RepID=UPI0007CDF6F1|nr:branched-chain amino acid transport system II carrier protein [[Haemophilus] ducreyi]ANF74415.1 branched-chain amino acid ABC transporter substrate-binding protein [[Haemophilus] ducreyi]ANF74852.1 branched-chain amino acid ABC transporter substrate-binding protein [[Haemophilus] ducreyi]